MLTPETIALVTLTFLCAGFVKGAVGLGIPIVALAFLAAALGLKATLALIVAPCVVANVWQGLAGPYLGEIMRRLWGYFLASCIGIWIGVGVLAGTSGDLLLGLMGLILCVYSLISLFSPQIPPPEQRREVYYGPLAGGVGGLLFGMTGTYIVPGLLYLQALGLKKDAMVQAMGVTFAVITASLGVAFAGRNLLTGDMIFLSLYAIVPTGIGWLLGWRYRSRISEVQFRRLFFLTLIAVGIYYMIRALFSF